VKHSILSFLVMTHMGQICITWTMPVVAGSVRSRSFHLAHFGTTLFHCRVSGGTLAGNDEGLDWDWFSPDALPDDLTAYARVWLADALSDARVVVR
jgi:hypothetical protein